MNLSISEKRTRLVDLSGPAEQKEEQGEGNEVSKACRV
jgi:hypothetical protein